MQSKKIRFGWSAGILGLLFFMLTSCGSGQQGDKQNEVAPDVEQSQEDLVITEPEPSTQPSTTEEVKLNPPHGQPGHRCEIPVGSPLDGSGAVQAPAASNAPPPPPATTESANSPASMAPTVENARRLNATQGTQTAAPATGEKPEFNPPHGQPWHRCDVAVGSPLP